MHHLMRVMPTTLEEARPFINSMISKYGKPTGVILPPYLARDAESLLVRTGTYPITYGTFIGLRYVIKSEEKKPFEPRAKRERTEPRDREVRHRPSRNKRR